MDYINKVELQGVIGRVKDTPPFIDFSLCTSEIYNTANASLIETIWHRVKVLSENVKITYPSLKSYRDEKVLIITPQRDLIQIFPQSEIQIEFE